MTGWKRICHGESRLGESHLLQPLEISMAVGRVGRHSLSVDIMHYGGHKMEKGIESRERGNSRVTVGLKIIQIITANAN